MARVAQTPLARSDLKEIGRRIAAESGSRDVAIQFLGSIDEKMQLYASQPELGERRPDLAEHVFANSWLGPTWYSIEHARAGLKSSVFFTVAVTSRLSGARVNHDSHGPPSAVRHRP
jgi:plasmid stabilization system protein ParE